MSMFLNSIIVRLFSLIVTTVSVVAYGKQGLADYKVINLQRDTSSLILDATKSQIIIFANRNTCKDCYRPLNSPSELLNQKLANGDINITFLCRVENNIPARKAILVDLGMWMPELVTRQNVFFDIYSDNYVYYKMAQSGVFAEFNINHTPAILLYIPNQEALLFEYHLLDDYLRSTRFFSIDEMIEFRSNWSK